MLTTDIVIRTESLRMCRNLRTIHHRPCIYQDVRIPAIPDGLRQCHAMCGRRSNASRAHSFAKRVATTDRSDDARLLGGSYSIPNSRWVRAAPAEEGRAGATGVADPAVGSAGVAACE